MTLFCFLFYVILKRETFLFNCSFKKKTGINFLNIQFNMYKAYIKYIHIDLNYASMLCIALINLSDWHL